MKSLKMKEKPQKFKKSFNNSLEMNKKSKEWLQWQHKTKENISQSNAPKHAQIECTQNDS